MKLERYKISPQWEHTKEEIWSRTFESLEESDAAPKARVVALSSVLKFAAAAVVAGALILTSFAALYTQHVDVQRGGHYTLFLPDSSKVELNAESALSFKPFWWRVSREVAMNGEAFFMVKKGSRFAVNCDNGVVKVMGTSFNVLSRDRDFAVACLTGKVSVTVGKQAVVLLPEMKASVVEETLMAAKIDNAKEVIAWTRNHFNFTNTPLIKVIDEIERQYNIRIRKPAKLDYIYTGNFFKTTDPQEALEIVGKPFGLSLTIDN